MLYGALFFKLYQLVRAPHRWTLWAVVGCLACFVLQSNLTRPALRDWVDSWSAPGVGKLVQNLFVLGLAFFLVAFFLIATSKAKAQARRRLLWLSVPLALTATLLAVSTFAVPAEVRAEVLLASNARHPWAATFFLTQLTYVIVSYTAAFYWAVRYYFIARQDTNRRLCHGLQIVGTGLGILIIACTLRAVLVVIQFSGGAVPPQITALGVDMVVAGIAVLLIGVSYSGLVTRMAALGNWLRHWWIYHQLRPLWTLFHEAYPQDALSRAAPSWWRDVLDFRYMHRRYYRRVIEIRDGMVRISPYLAHLQEQHPTGRQLTPTGLAAQLHAALAAQAQALPVTSSAVAVALPERNGLDDDARQLLAVAQALPSR
ncbi:hypothetical protein N8J89_16230 [Crossiella sp. CA-258035]|uniref:MAB_1171c family putative transporter n=1 Tax=Crossiella sp. CA-258035 TaxID=2981138 RepID=UPI0024BC63E8|nr:MAB_1171c family putative transporter [Crossiella sp. CA-258035]WHT22546.1 hypothetical protein N8J89_16230 [Crossiella sp. CA-258035]